MTANCHVTVTQILTSLTIKEGDAFQGKKFLIHIHYDSFFTVPLW